jgi:hypothetical protein
LKIEKQLYSFDDENGNTCMLSSFSVKLCAVVPWLLHFQSSFVRAQLLSGVARAQLPAVAKPVTASRASAGTCFFYYFLVVFGPG